MMTGRECEYIPDDALGSRRNRQIWWIQIV